MFRKLLCKIGWHTWTWKKLEGDIIFLGGDPPDRAKCCHCGIKFKE